MIHLKKAGFKTILTLIIGFLFIVSARAQHENLLDSLAKNNSFDQRRIFYGYIESKSRNLANEQNYTSFLRQVEKFAIAEKETELLKDVVFVRTLKDSVFYFSKDKWLPKLELLILKYKNQKDDLLVAYLYHEKGQLEFQEELYQHAFESNLKCQEIIEKIGYAKVPKIGKIAHEIALHYYFFKDYKQVIRWMRISIKFPPFSRGLDMQRYNNLGLSYHKIQQNDSARYFYKKGLEVANSYGADVWKGLIASNLGNLYYDQSKWDSSYYYYQQNYRYNASESLHSTIKLNALIDMAKIHLALDSVAKCVRFLQIAEDQIINNPIEKHIGDRQQIEKTKLAFYQTKIKYLTKIGDYKAALMLKDSVVNLEARLYQKYNSAIIQLSEKEITINQKEASLIATAKTRKVFNYYYLCLLLLLLTAGSVGYYYLNRSKMKKIILNDALLAQNKMVTLEKQQTKEELKVAREQMQFFVSKISDQNKLVSQLEAELELSKTMQMENSSSIEQSIHKLKDVRILTDENWVEFQENFDTLFPDFRFILKTKQPSITSSEIRYLMLTQLQFSHKEMALALGVSASTMRVTWNRVRKRLNGTLEDTPVSLLKKVLDREPYLN